MRIARAIVGGFLLGLANVLPSHADTRVALVIGNSSYASVAALPNPKRDAEAVTAALRNVGFQSVTMIADAGREELVKALGAFAREADSADWALVYFAGHGIEVGGTNYVIPVDARLVSDRDVSVEAISLDQIMTYVEGAKRLRIVILDACRENPFLAKMLRKDPSRSIGRGLARYEPVPGSIVVFAAKEGQIARDGDASNSPFTTAFLKNLKVPKLDVRRLFDLVRDDVMEITGRRQQPFAYSSVSGREEFYLFTTPAGLAPTTPQTFDPILGQSRSKIPAEKKDFTRVVASGKTQLIGFFNSLNPDCTVMGDTEIRITKQPAHGSVETKPATNFPSYPKEHVRAKCNEHRVGGTQVNYKSAEKYVGSDAVEMLALFPSGFAWEVHYDISVLGQQVAPTSRSKIPAEKREFNRVVGFGKSQRIGFYTWLNPDCTVMGDTEIRITKQPEHGSVETKPATNFPGYPKEHVLAKCNEHRVRGMQVNYKSAEKYVGSDAVELLALFPSGFAWEVHYDISVR
jgi:caspase domain-containing protein